MTKIIFLSLIAFCCANAGESPMRITNANFATYSQFPYSASIQEVSQLASTLRGHRCGGALITLQHVLTAASCVYNTVNGVLQPIQPIEYRVFAGSVLLADDNSTDRIRNVQTVTPHPSYAPSANLDNDIAIITLVSPFSSNVVTPISLPDNSFVPADGQNCTNAGWGAFNRYVLASPELRFAYKYIWNKNSCTSYFNSANNEPAVPSLALCAEYSDTTVASCKGDHGNALLCNGVLSGILIHGINCTSVIRPEIYTQVSSYNAWIRTVTGSSTNSSNGAEYQQTSALLGVFTAVHFFITKILH